MAPSGERSEQAEQGTKKPGQVAQNQAQVVSGAAQQRVGRIAQGLAIAGIAGVALHADDQAFAISDRDGNTPTRAR